MQHLPPWTPLFQARSLIVVNGVRGVRMDLAAPVPSNTATSWTTPRGPASYRGPAVPTLGKGRCASRPVTFSCRASLQGTVCAVGTTGSCVQLVGPAPAVLNSLRSLHHAAQPLVSGLEHCGPRVARFQHAAQGGGKWAASWGCRGAHATSDGDRRRP